MSRFVHSLLFSAAMVGSLAGHAAPGELDPGFASNGVHNADPGEQYGDVAVDSLGRIYILRDGSEADCAAGGCGVMTRLTPAGQPDAAFGANGRRIVSIGQAHQLGTRVLGVVTVQQDDKVLFFSMSGFTPNTTTLPVERLNSDGTPDSGFNVIQTGLSPLGTTGRYQVLAYPDGRILVSTRSRIFRTLPDGSTDSSFSEVNAQGGVIYWQSIALSSDGGIVIGGAYDAAGSVFRRLNDGSPDPAFGTGGTVILFPNGGSSQSAVMRVALQADGKILAGGIARLGTGAHYRYLTRLTTSGALDATFGTNGTAVFPHDCSGTFAQCESYGEVVVQPDGRIAFAVTDRSSGKARVALTRVTSTGALDTTFGNGGVATFDLAPGDDESTDVVRQPTGDLIIGARGSDGNAFRVARVLAGGSAIRLDPQWLPPAGLNRPYSKAIAATGGTGPYTLGAFNNALPPGLALSGDTLTGTPTVAGEHRFFLTATDSTAAEGSRHYVFEVHTAATLVASYYQSVLGRVADSGGQAYWEGEVTRMTGLGASANDAFHAMAGVFFGSAEYAALAKNDGAFVNDLFDTFFGRDGDAAGLAYWTQQLAAGNPRGGVLNAFLFSPEFLQAMTGIFGPVTSRAETSMVMDFYRGVLGRLPDSGGFNSWVQRFRAAQCAGNVVSEVNAISSAFVNSGEYSNRQSALQDQAARDSAFVVDMYNAFMRRGGDLSGHQHWVAQLQSGGNTREQVRQQFIASPEFQARVAAVQAAECVP